MIIKKSKYLTLGLLLLSGMEALICGIYLFTIPADPKNAVFAGFSEARLVLMAFFLFFFIISALSALYINRNYSWVVDMADRLDHHEAVVVLVQFIFVLLTVSGAISVFRSPQDYGRYASIFTRLQPFIVWITLFSVQTGVFWLVNYFSFYRRVVPKALHSLAAICLYVASFLLKVIKNLFYPNGDIKEERGRWVIVLTIWAIIPISLIVTLNISSAVPMLYVVILLTYFIVAGLLIRAVKIKASLIVLLVLFILITCSRLLSHNQVLNGKDLTIFSFYDIDAGNSIEQDFYLPKNNEKFDVLLRENNNSVIFRFLGNVDLDKTELIINGTNLGKLQDLLYREPQTPFSGNEVNNYFFTIPADLLINQSLITVRIVSTEDYQIGYSSGIHPLPQITHVRLVESHGDIIDLSDQYENRRFRFQMGFYIISNLYHTEDLYPLILGTIL